MKLTINKIKETDEGEYYCHAENAFGSSTQPVSVRIRNVVRAGEGVTHTKVPSGVNWNLLCLTPLLSRPPPTT